jgi:hypothetical protein
MCAKEAARHGLSVLVLEAGSHHLPSQMNQREGDMLPRLFYDAGGRGTADGAVMILHGRGIGGSTVHNTNLCKRAPDEVLRHWATDFGCATWTPEAIADDYAAVEAELHVSPLTEADVNRNNAIMRRGVERLGWRGGLLAHNRVGCQRSGFCELGCSYNAKENAAKILIPEALRLGAQIFCDVRVQQIRHDGKKVKGVRAVGVREDGRDGDELFVNARAVCVAGSAVLSPALLLHSDVPDPYQLAGRSLRLHPGVAVGGCFADPVEAWKGIPQSYECTEKLSFAPGAADRCWLIPGLCAPRWLCRSTAGVWCGACPGNARLSADGGGGGDAARRHARGGVGESSRSSGRPLRAQRARCAVAAARPSRRRRDLAGCRGAGGDGAARSASAGALGRRLGAAAPSSLSAARSAADLRPSDGQPADGPRCEARRGR